MISFRSHLKALVRKAAYHWGEALESIHGRLSLGVQVGGLAGASDNECVALVSYQVDLALDVPLAEDDGVVEELSLWAKVHAVVEAGGPVGGDHLVTDGTDLGVHDKTLDISVSGAQDGQAGGVVAATALETNESGFDNVDTANSIDAANFVGGLEDFQGASDGLATNLKLDWDALFEVDSELGWLVGGLHGIFSS